MSAHDTNRSARRVGANAPGGLCGRVHERAGRRCWSCAGRARLIHLLVLSGHRPEAIAQRLALTVSQVEAAVSWVQAREPLDELAADIISRWGPLPFDLTPRTVANLRALTHVPCRLVCEQVDGAIARSHAPHRAAGIRPPAGADGLLSYARIATLSGIDERRLKRALGLIPEPVGHRPRTRDGQLVLDADGNPQHIRVGGRINRAISLPTAWKICRALDVAPADIPGL